MHQRHDVDVGGVEQQVGVAEILVGFRPIHEAVVDAGDETFQPVALFGQAVVSVRHFPQERFDVFVFIQAVQQAANRGHSGGHGAMALAQRFFQREPPAAVADFVGDAQVANVGKLRNVVGEGDGAANGFGGIDRVGHGAVGAFGNLGAVFGQRVGLAEGNRDTAQEAAVSAEIVQELLHQFKIDGVGELVRGFVFQMVRLVNDDAVVFRQQAANFQILEEQRVVRDDDARLFTLALAVEIAAFVVEWAASAEAGIRRAGDVLPILIFGLVEVQMFAVAAVVLSVPEHQ